MEYVQMTLDDWVQMKQKLRQELIGVKQSFVRIGYALRQIDDQRLYENDGYKSIAEFAKAEYGLEASTTSRFISINREYSIDGYSEHLRPEYTDLGRSQLEEMLKLPDSDRQMIQPEASREDIRELKRFNKTEPAAGVADDISQLIEKFFEDNKDILNEVYSNEFDEESMNRFAEIVNPAGNRSFKKGLYFMMMYENRVTIKKFGDTPKICHGGNSTRLCALSLMRMQQAPGHGRTILEEIMKYRKMSQQESILQQKLLSQRMTMQQLEKLALMRSKRLNREAWQIMSRLLEQEKSKRMIPPTEIQTAERIIESLQTGPRNRQEKRALESKLRRRKNPHKSLKNQSLRALKRKKMKPKA